MAVDVASEKVVETTDRPLYGAYGGQGSAFLFLYWITDDERLRADLAVSPLEVRLEDGQVHCVAHNIGSRDVASFDAALVDDKGAVRHRKTLGPLKAPLELEPQRLDFALPAPPEGAKGWSVVLDPEGKIEEIYKGNNRAAVP
jgi:hypothetical protein